MTYCYENDQWTLEDGLGMGGTGDILARTVLEARPPFSVRVTGKWGSGKTSVLRRAFATLGGLPVQQAVPLGENMEEGEPAEWKKYRYDSEEGRRQEKLQWPASSFHIAEKSLCVWYSPWQHQVASNPLVPLLLEIQAQFSTRIRIKKKLTEINRRGGLAALKLMEQVIDTAVSLKFGKSIGVHSAGEVIRKAWKDSASRLLDLSDGQRFHLLFEDAVKNVLQSLPEDDGVDNTEGRLLVFIDDLDRCEESVVIKLLECIKLYLGSPRCVFILGVDDEAVLGAMKRCWAGRSNEDNREYLEKMFQATISVPVPRPRKIQAYIRKQLEANQFPLDEFSTDDFPPDIFPPDGDKNDCAVIIERLLEPNPRKIKNFCNSLCAAWRQFRGKDSANPQFAPRFVLFYYLRLFHRPIWRLLERQPGILPLLHSVLTGSPPQAVNIGGLDREDQRILREILERNFSHVLRDNTAGKSDADLLKYHRNMSLDEAVRLFEQRIDAKRSDEFFANCFRAMIGPDEALDENLLYMPEDPVPVSTDSEMTSEESPEINHDES